MDFTSKAAKMIEEIDSQLNSSKKGTEFTKEELMEVYEESTFIDYGVYDTHAFLYTSDSDMYEWYEKTYGVDRKVAEEVGLISLCCADNDNKHWYRTVDGKPKELGDDEYVEVKVIDPYNSEIHFYLLDGVYLNGEEQRTDIINFDYEIFVRNEMKCVRSLFNRYSFQMDYDRSVITMSLYDNWENETIYTAQRVVHDSVTNDEFTKQMMVAKLSFLKRVCSDLNI